MSEKENKMSKSKKIAIFVTVALVVTIPATIGIMCYYKLGPFSEKLRASSAVTNKTKNHKTTIDSIPNSATNLTQAAVGNLPDNGIPPAYTRKDQGEEFHVTDLVYRDSATPHDSGLTENNTSAELAGPHDSALTENKTSAELAGPHDSVLQGNNTGAKFTEPHYSGLNVNNTSAESAKPHDSVLKGNSTGADSAKPHDSVLKGNSTSADSAKPHVSGLTENSTSVESAKPHDSVLNGNSTGADSAKPHDSVLKGNSTSADSAKPHVSGLNENSTSAEFAKPHDSGLNVNNTSAESSKPLGRVLKGNSTGAKFTEPSHSVAKGNSTGTESTEPPQSVLKGNITGAESTEPHIRVLKGNSTGAESIEPLVSAMDVITTRAEFTEPLERASFDFEVNTDIKNRKAFAAYDKLWFLTEEKKDELGRDTYEALEQNYLTGHVEFTDTENIGIVHVLARHLSSNTTLINQIVRDRLNDLVGALRPLQNLLVELACHIKMRKEGEKVSLLKYNEYLYTIKEFAEMKKKITGDTNLYEKAILEAQIFNSTYSKTNMFQMAKGGLEGTIAKEFFDRIIPPSENERIN